MKKIEIEIDTDGGMSIDLQNFHGKGCQKEIDAFSAGDKPTLTRHKPEYREQEQQKEKNRA